MPFGIRNLLVVRKNCFFYTKQRVDLGWWWIPSRPQGSVCSAFARERRIRDSDPAEVRRWEFPILVDVLHVQVHNKIAQLNAAVVDKLVFNLSPITSQTSPRSAAIEQGWQDDGNRS